MPPGTCLSGGGGVGQSRGGGVPPPPPTVYGHSNAPLPCPVVSLCPPPPRRTREPPQFDRGAHAHTVPRFPRHNERPVPYPSPLTPSGRALCPCPPPPPPRTHCHLQREAQSRRQENPEGPGALKPIPQRCIGRGGGTPHPNPLHGARPMPLATVPLAASASFSRICNRQ